MAPLIRFAVAVDGVAFAYASGVLMGGCNRPLIAGGEEPPCVGGGWQVCPGWRGGWLCDGAVPRLCVRATASGSYVPAKRRDV